MTDPTAPQAAPAPAGGYPVSLSFNAPDRVARWRPIVHWLLAIPHYIVLYVLGLVSSVLALVSWVIGVIAGRVPEGLQQFQTMYLRYNARVFSYIVWTRGEYPAFSFPAVFADPGDDRIRVEVTPDLGKRSRLTIFFRLILLIPHMIVLGLLGIVFYVVMIIGWFAVIILGRWPSGLLDFVIGFLRWSTRVNGYYLLLTDEYPPFRLS